MDTLSAHYEPGGELERYAAWERAGLFEPRPAAARFSMILPPPNITGALHAGHAYEHTISDAVIRHRRMAGFSTLWIPGTDHAGIATQTRVEAQLAAEGLTRHDIGRDAFLERTWRWREATGDRILEQMRRLGASPDWSRTLFTLDRGPSIATHTAFSTLFNQGLIYRADRPTSWCDRCTTSLADIETTERDGTRFCARCDSPITTKATPQWFLATAELGELARTAVTSGALRIDPPQMTERWLTWLDGIEDWCLSRQLWWGHQIPIWYAPDGTPHSFAPGEEIPDGFTRDDDTLDTWFSSALWPLSTLGWPQRTADLERFYPNDLLITGYDLIFFWAIRMTMLCTHLSGTPPFRRLFLHGMIRDSSGAKMSKSKGNTVDPMEWIDRFGPDATRFAFARAARAGADIPFGDSDLAGADAWCSKLWSTARLAAHHHITLDDAGSCRSSHLLDRWLLDRLERTIAAATAAFDELDLAAATEALTRFLFEDLSELYLEARKAALAADSQARATFAAALAELLLLAHPIGPHLTEHLAGHLGIDGPLDLQPWPGTDAGRLDDDARTAGEQLRSLTTQLRSYRSTAGLPAGDTLPAALHGVALADELAHLARLTRCAATGGATFTCWAATVTLAPLEPRRLDAARRRLGELAAQIRNTRGRLEGPTYRERAPAHIQQQLAAHLEQLVEERARLEQILPDPA